MNPLGDRRHYDQSQRRLKVPHRLEGHIVELLQRRCLELVFCYLHGSNQTMQVKVWMQNRYQLAAWLLIHPLEIQVRGVEHCLDLLPCVTRVFQFQFQSL